MTSSSDDAVVAVPQPDGSVKFGFDPAGAKFDMKWVNTTNTWGSTTGRLHADVDLSKLPAKKDYGKIDNSVVQKFYDKYVKHSQWNPNPDIFAQMADAADKWRKSAKKMAKSVEKVGDGLAELRKANDIWEKKQADAKAEARVAVTEEKVYTLMETNYLPYDYARRLLEEAYVDSILNEGKTHDIDYGA